MDWRKLEATVDKTVASAFGESVRLSFFTSSGTVDPSRDLVDIRAVLHTGGDDSNTAGLQDGFRVRLSAGSGELFINRSNYDGPAIRTGDRVRANDRAGQPWFEVHAISDRYSNLLVLSLNQS